MTAEELEQLASAFIARTLPRAQWTHLAHLRVGAWHVHHLGAEEAIEKLRERIRRLNDAHGTANTDTGGYHETVTIAYVRLLDPFLDACPAPMPLEAKIELLTSGPLAARDLLFRFYSRPLLMSPEARRAWVTPDRAALVLPIEPMQKNR